MYRRLLAAAVLVGALTATGGATWATSGHAAAAAAGTGAGPARVAALSVHKQLIGRPRHKGRLFRHLLNRARTILRVTTVSGNSISATTLNGIPVTITVTTSTTYQEAGSSASLSAIQPGYLITGRGTRTGNHTFQANAIVILLPHVTGVVTSVSNSSLTVTGLDAAPHTIVVSSSTRYARAGQSAAINDINVGTAIRAAGPLNADGSMNALRIQIVLPHVAGKIIAVNGSSLTVSNVWGATHTVVTSSSTRFVAPGRASFSATSLATGMHIIAQGTLSPDGKTLTAQRVVVLPASRWAAKGGLGSMGPGMGAWGMGFQGSTPVGA